MGYIVKAPLVIAKNDEGGDTYVYEGAPVPEGQSDEWIKQHVDSEMIAEDGDSSQRRGRRASSATSDE